MNTERMLGRSAKRIAFRKINWFCCNGHDGWINHKHFQRKLKQSARRQANKENYDA